MPTPADFRAEIARRQLRLYDLAPRVGIHPTRLGALLNEKIPMTPAVAERIVRHAFFVFHATSTRDSGCAVSAAGLVASTQSHTRL